MSLPYFSDEQAAEKLGLLLELETVVAENLCVIRNCSHVQAGHFFKREVKE